MGQVVGTEGEELGNSSGLTGNHGGARDFDHGTELVGEVDFLFFHHCFGNRDEAGLDPFELVDVTSQGDHDLRFHNDATQGAVSGSFKDGADLHFDDLRHGDGETHTTQTHHRVAFVHGLHCIE
ncbi:hypothetical protein SDC9_88433 [bioreactor metagenome]|uniref:Uncharacterized protein n=1 Tax=bioreactor metagenome TaxID=1076179 RepID=A0A644ZW30_9ZZZZ